MLISAAANVEVPAYLSLKEMGFEIACIDNSWTAKKRGLELIGNSPLEVLGLAAMYERRGERWQAADDQINSFLAEYQLG